MDQQQLREHLEELNVAINNLQASDADKGKLVELIVDIERQLNEPMLETGEPQTLEDQVDGLISTFEQEHPVVAGILNNIMITLGNIGV